MNKFAQLLYGKVIYIYETDLKQSELSTIFDPSTYWVDITGITCEVGYIVSFDTNIGLVFTAPETDDTQQILPNAPVNEDTLALAEAVLELSAEVDKLKGGSAQ